MNVMQSPP